MNTRRIGNITKDILEIVAKIGELEFDLIKKKRELDDAYGDGAEQTPTLNEEEIALIKDGHKIAAIKSLRGRIRLPNGDHFGLKDAKDVVDNYEQLMTTPKAY